MKHYFLFLIILMSLIAKSQNVGINATGLVADPSAALDIVSNNKGLLVPRVALTAINSPLPITAPLTSLLVYNTAISGALPNNVVPGYYYWNGGNWVSLSGAISGGFNWSLFGNSGTNATTNFIGTVDANDLVFKTNNTEKMRVLVGGNVGIGTNSPIRKLHVEGTIAQVSTIDIDHSFLFKNNVSGRDWQLYHLSSTHPSSPNGFVFEHYDGALWRQRMTINQNGNIGINTTMPSAKLHV